MGRSASTTTTYRMPIAGPQAPAPVDLVESLAEQLDLAEVRIDEGTRVFRNSAWFSTRAILDDVDAAEAPSGALVAGASHDLADAATPALTDVDGITDFDGPVGDGDVLWHAAAASSGWKLTVDGEAARRADGFGFGTTYAVPAGGDAELRYSTPVYRLLLSGLQAAAWVLAIRTAWRLRRRLRRAAAEVGA